MFISDLLRHQSQDIFLPISQIVRKNFIKMSLIIKEWVSEWLLFNANSTIFQLYHGEDKLIFNEVMTRSALY
jgi:hypothetical protein